MADRPVADGIVEQAPDGSTRIRFVRRLPHAIDRVWEALTDPAELHRWWGGTDLELAEGGRFTVRWRNEDPAGNAAILVGAPGGPRRSPAPPRRHERLLPSAPA